MQSLQRLLARAVGLTVAMALAVPAIAQTFPSKPLRIIVAYAPGGATDALARQLAFAVTEKTGQQAIVENRPGGASAIAINQLAASPADGYTVLLSDPSSTTTNPFLFKKLTYKPEAMQPVTRITKHYIALFVRSDSPYRNLNDFVAAAKASPGKLMFSHAGQGTNTQLMGLQFNHLAGISVPDVAYKGDLPALQDVLAGNVPAFWGVVNSAVPYIQAGTLRTLGVMSESRIGAIPEVPTFAEQGYPSMTTTSWFGIFTASGVPASTVAQLNGIFGEAAKSSKVTEYMKANAMDALPGSVQDLASLVRADATLYSDVIRRANLTLD